MTIPTFIETIGQELTQNVSEDMSCPDPARIAQTPECDNTNAFQTWLAPSAILWAVVPLYVLFLLPTRKSAKEAVNPLKTTKICTAVFLACLLSVQLTREAPGLCETVAKHVMENVGIWSKLTCLLISLMAMKSETRHGSTSTTPFVIFWGGFTATNALEMYTRLMSGSQQPGYTDLILSVLIFVGSAFQLVLSLIRDGKKVEEDGKDVIETQEDHPEMRASILGNLTMSWMTKNVWRGFRHGLEEDDVPNVASHDKCQTLSPVFEETFRKIEAQASQNIHTTKETDKAPKPLTKKDKKEDTGPKRNVLFKTIAKTYGLHFVLCQSAKVFFEVFNFVHTLIMAELINYIQNRETESTWKGYALIVTLFFFSIFFSCGHHRAWMGIHRLAKKIKTVMKIAVFKKSLTAKNMSKKYLTAGEIGSLVSDDCNKVVNSTATSFFLISAPFEILTALYFLYQEMGMGSMAALVVVIIMCPFSVLIGRRLEKLNIGKEEFKSNRIKLMNEILNGIKVLKLYAWENSFIKKVNAVRDSEVKMNKQIGLFHAGLDFVFCTIPYFIRIAGFYVFISLGGFMNPSTVFVAVAMFRRLNEPFARLPVLFPGYIEAYESLKRINKYLTIDDIPEDVVTKDPDSKVAVSISDGTFTWDTESDRTHLKDINVEIPKKGLIAVVGRVGCGKSSLLSSMLGEMEKLSGSVVVQSDTAFVPQEAWIQSCSLKDNILFGSEYDEKRYNKVVDSCALRTDLDILSAGDRTEIGEKGINLSGGQKQRVSLARAVYNEADIYLLDDPLSAVDAHVGKHIFNQVIGHKGMLRNKTRVMVTHGVHWLPFVDSIIVMKDGRVSERGTFSELVAHNGEFSEFLKEVCSHSSADAGFENVKEKIISRMNSREPGKDEKNFSSGDEEELLKKEEEEVQDTQESKTETKPNENDGKMIEDEDVESGNVSKKVYFEYIKAVGIKFFVLCMVLYVCEKTVRECNNFWLGQWGDDQFLANRSLADTEEYQETMWNYLQNYTLLGAVEVAMSFCFISIVLTRGHEAARYHHNKLLNNILRLPMSFFDTTPTGRIINRFSKDIGAVDGLAGCLRGYICCITELLGNLFMVIFACPEVIPYLIPIAITYAILEKISRANFRQLRRFTTKSRSPVFVHLNETLNGADSVRAYGAQKRFIKKMEDRLENSIRFEITEIWTANWFNIRLNLLSAILTLVSTVSLLWNPDMTPGKASVVLMSATHFMHCLGWFIHHASHTEVEMTSMERVIEYSNKPTEADWEKEDCSPPLEWPQNGELVFDDYQTRYREGLDLVLRGVSCKINSGEKIGIVGRTGAGKSSLTVALFRLIESAAGKISIDGQTIAPLGLHDLRKKLTILPQDPVVFGGSLRMNLDPFETRTTEELWDALKHSHLKDFVESLSDQLEYDCGEGGKNLSVGQRQLICLARALLRKTQILVLDEATAGVDMKTDDLIQNTIRTEFKDCTVLTIAHRLNTIMDYDRIMVLDNGKIKEFDSPKNLLANPESTFYSLAKESKLV